MQALMVRSIHANDRSLKATGTCRIAELWKMHEKQGLHAQMVPVKTAIDMCFGRTFP